MDDYRMDDYRADDYRAGDYRAGDYRAGDYRAGERYGSIRQTAPLNGDQTRKRHSGANQIVTPTASEEIT